MPMPLIALIPAMLMAGAAHAQSAEPMPQAEPEVPVTQQAEPETEAEEEKPAPPPEVDTTEVSGTWERTNGNGRDTVTYTSEAGEVVFSASCMTADTEFGDRIVQIKAASAEDTVGAIDIFTSAGNAQVPAAPDVSPDTAAGLVQPVSQQTYVLASGAGEMRIVSGARGIVFETDPMLKQVVRGCHPSPGAAVQAPAETEEGDAVEPAESAATNS